MANQVETDSPVGLSKTRLVAAAAEIAAGLTIAASLAALLIWLAVATQRAEAAPSVERVLLAVALALGGVIAGVVLLALAENLRKLDAVQGLLEQQGGARSALPAAGRAPVAGSGFTARPPESDQEAWTQMVLLLREMRDISMLDDEQRRLRLEVQGRELARRLQHEVPAFLRDHNWNEATKRVLHARERFPHLSEWDKLDAQIEDVRARVERRDVENATRQVNDLAALGAWTRAMDVVREVLERHPGSDQAARLFQRVRAEQERAVAEQIARLMHQAQDATNRRDWHAALKAANALIEQFPKSPDAEALRQQLPTLRENAEIQTRQQMEADFRALLKDHHYEEALTIARELIARYPNSPQAQVLQDQLPRLEQKADATRATP